MPEATIEKAVCEKCGADVRENTVFCYNCGSPLAEGQTSPDPESNGSVPSADAETKAALDDLAEKMSITESADGDKLAKAAAERKKARVIQRRSREFVWEPIGDTSGRLIVLVAILIAMIVAVIVFLTVY